jgi:uncharacterized protein YegP (UPF0339 family)
MTDNLYEVYQAADGWRWRLVAPNGRIVADSGEAFASRSNATRSIRAIDPNAAIDARQIKGKP